MEPIKASSINSLARELLDKQKFKYLRSDTNRVVRGGNDYDNLGGAYRIRQLLMLKKLSQTLFSVWLKQLIQNIKNGIKEMR